MYCILPCRGERWGGCGNTVWKNLVPDLLPSIASFLFVLLKHSLLCSPCVCGWAVCWGLVRIGSVEDGYGMFKLDFSRGILDDLVVCGGQRELGDGAKRQGRERRGGRGRGIRV